MSLPNWPQHANNLRKIDAIRKNIIRLVNELRELAEQYDCTHHISYYSSPIDITYAIQRQIKLAKEESSNSPCYVETT